MMWHIPVLWLGPVALALLVVYVATSLTLHKRLIGRLHSKHQVLWLDLGAPTLWDVILSVRNRPQVSASGKLTYFGWLSARGYADLHDEVAARMGRQLALHGWALLVPVAVLSLLVLGSLQQG